DSGIQGIIFNGISAVMYQFLIPVVEQAGLKPLGFLPYQPELSVASRHLGLVTAAEIIDIRQKMTELGRLAEQCLDLEGILALAATAPPLREQPLCYPQVAKIRIAVARDKAFCFIYRENIELLEAMGAELVYFSPLVDSSLPEQIDGLYLCGGYPELYQEQLSANQNLRQQIAEKIANGLPTIAECGGFMYLHQWLGDWPMVGTIAGKAYPTPKLQRFGYLNITAKKDNLVALAGESIRAHEFHYWESENCGDSFGGEKAGGKSSYSCIHATPTLYAGFPHLYFPANPKFAENFIKKTKEYAAIHNV
ncbi:MAG: cobyrinic acid a,c-diamide synthase, partial [Clostridiales bacterium]